MSELNSLDVLINLSKIKDIISKKSDKDLLLVLTKLRTSRLKLDLDIKEIANRFNQSGKLNEEDRKIIEQCHWLLHTKVILEE